MRAIMRDAIALRRTLEAELAPSRELSLALTKLDECAMWAGAGWQVQNDGRPGNLEALVRELDRTGGVLS